MFEHFTEKARRSIFFGRYEASQLGSPEIGVEHLLLGLLREGKEWLDLILPDTSARNQIRMKIDERTLRREKMSTSVDLPVSNDVKRTFALAAEEADKLAHAHIGCEHLLLGLLQIDGSLAAELIKSCGANLQHIREELAKAPSTRAELAESQPENVPPRPKPRHRSPRTQALELAEDLLSGMDELFGPRIQFSLKGHDDYTERARMALFVARVKAMTDGAKEVESHYLLLALLREARGDYFQFLPHTVTIAAIYRRINQEKSFRINPANLPQIPFGEACQHAMEHAKSEAASLGHTKVGVEHLIIGLLREDCLASQLLREHGTNVDELRRKLAATVPPGAAPSDRGSS